MWLQNFLRMRCWGCWVIPADAARQGALRLALMRVSVTRFEGLLCRAVQSGTLYGFLQRKLYTPRPLYNLGPPTHGARFTVEGGCPSPKPPRDAADAPERIM
jgi:hypothetical protein